MSDSMPLDEVSETPPKENANRRSIPKHWIVLGLLVFAHAAFGVSFTTVLRGQQKYPEIISPILIGFLYSQPIMFAIWAAFAPQRFYHRILWSLLLCTLVSFAEDLGTLRLSSVRPGYTMMVFIILFIVVTIILLLVRFFRWQMTQSFELNIPTDYRANQFGIKHLIILTTIVALAFGLFRTLLLISSQQTFPPVAKFIGSICLILTCLYA